MALSQTEQQRVTRDIVNWAVDSGEVRTDEEIEEYVEELEAASASRIEDMWFSNVGEWVNSRDDVYGAWVDAGEPNQSPAEWQFEKLCSSGSNELDYWYTEYVYDTY